MAVARAIDHRYYHPWKLSQDAQRYDFPNVSVLEELHEKLGAMIPEQLPGVDASVWKPSLDASSRWIDEQCGMVLAR